MIVDGVTEPLQRAFEMFLEKKAGVIGANRDAHRRQSVLCSCSPMSPTATVNLRGAERVANRHPWIYRADLVNVRANAGDRVLVRGPRGHVLGQALYSDASQIALRMLTDGETVADDELIRSRVEAAIAYRRSLGIDATAYRLVHGEADLLPSLIVDRYGDYLVVQALSQGAERLTPFTTETLNTLLEPAGILARNDARTRELEGLERRIDVLSGEVPESIVVVENGIAYSVDVRRGQKTGLFLDQRENREAARRYARGRLLDCFSYNGGFALTLASACDEVIAIDISEDAIARVRTNAEKNGLAIDARVGNVFDELRGLERLKERFDTIVLDPPAFAKNKAAVAKAVTGYKEINLRALKLLNPGGTLVTCSCSYHVNEAQFAELIYDAAIDARVHVSVVEKRMQGRDHPVLLGVPETYYLKCFILRKLS